MHFMCSGTLKCLIQHSSEPVYTAMFYIHELHVCSAFHRYCNSPVSQCVVHFMCSGTLKCLIQHSSEQVYTAMFLFMNYMCVEHFIDTVIVQ